MAVASVVTRESRSCAERVVINGSSPSAVGLLGAWPVFACRGAVVEAVRGTVLPFVNGGTIVPSAEGPALDGDGSDRGAYGPAPASYLGWGQYSLVWIGYIVGTPQINSIFAGLNYSANGGNNPYAIAMIGGGNSGGFTFYTNDGVTYCTIGGGASFVSSQLRIAVGRVRNGVQDLWVDGVQVATGSVTYSSLIFSDSQIGLGVGWDGLGRNSASKTIDTRLYNRFISDSEIARLSNPFTRYDLYRQR